MHALSKQVALIIRVLNLLLYHLPFCNQSEFPLHLLDGLFLILQIPLRSNEIVHFFMLLIIYLSKM